MSRFGDARWQRLAVWSGAALAWGSTLTAVFLEPARLAGSEEPIQAEGANHQAALPATPSGGLLVIRYQPVSDPVEVVAPPPLSPPPPQPAPQPTSSGS